MVIVAFDFDSINSDQIEILLNNSTDEESDGCARVAISGRDVGGNNRYDAYTIDGDYIYIPCQSVFVQAAPMRKQTGRITISIVCIGDAVLPGT